MKYPFLTLAFFVFLILIWKLYIPQSSIVGKYVNNNTEYVLEGPRPIQEGQDTLELYHNNTFKSKTWGKGTYEVESVFLGKEIHLSYNYTFGKAGVSSQITKSYLGKIRIWLSHDLGFYFEKID